MSPVDRPLESTWVVFEFNLDPGSGRSVHQSPPKSGPYAVKIGLSSWATEPDRYWRIHLRTQFRVTDCRNSVDESKPTVVDVELLRWESAEW